MSLAVETRCHKVQNMSVAAENEVHEEALIEWQIINTCMHEWAISATLRLTLISLMSEYSSDNFIFRGRGKARQGVLKENKGSLEGMIQGGVLVGVRASVRV